MLPQDSSWKGIKESAPELLPQRYHKTSPLLYFDRRCFTQNRLMKKLTGLSGMQQRILVIMYRGNYSLGLIGITPSNRATAAQ
jgi:hypothetical protein